MSQPVLPAGYPTDAHVARPGTSDALTARTIDATVHPPLVRARETVVGVIPRVADAAAPLASPLFLGLLALTLLFVWVAHRMRYRPSALLLGVLLVMGLTSFRPVETPEPKRVAIARIPRTMTRAASPNRWNTRPPPPRDVGDQIGGVFRSIPMPRSPEGDVSAALLRAAEQVRDNEQVQEAVQEAMEQLRYRVREEVRSRRWRQLAARYRARHGEFERIDLVFTR